MFFFYLNDHYCKIYLTIGHLFITHNQNDNNRFLLLRSSLPLLHPCKTDGTINASPHFGNSFSRTRDIGQRDLKKRVLK